MTNSSELVVGRNHKREGRCRCNKFLFQFHCQALLQALITPFNDPHAARPRMRATIADDLPFDLSVHYTIGSWILARLFWMNNMILPLGVASAPNLFREKARFLCYSVRLLIESMFFNS